MVGSKEGSPPVHAPPAPQVEVTAAAGGVLYLRNPRPDPDYDRSVIEWLRHWAQVDPNRDWLAVRGPDNDWVRTTFGQAHHQADALAQALIDRGLGQGDCVLILGSNSTEQAALILGAMTAGVVAAPTSPAYALQSADFAKLKIVMGICRPRLIFVQDGVRFAPALAAVNVEGVDVVAVDNVGEGQTPFASLLATQPTPAVEAAYAATGPDTVAKILFTSGSTGLPKGVINTQRMLTSNVAMYDSLLPEAEHLTSTVVLNWLPWNHTMAGNSLFNNSLRHGRTYYVDDGKPLPGEFERTLHNIAEVQPYFWSDVPAGFARLADALERDPYLKKRFFEGAQYLSYAAADLPGELRERLQSMSMEQTGRRIPFYCGYGSTEAGPMVTLLHWETDHAGVIGLPPPGLELKLVPVDEGRYDLRFRGPNLTPGYLRDLAQTAKALDEEGFFSLGDAVRFVDPADPLQGLKFAGRLAEDFKLATGTFVLVGAVRTGVLGVLGSLARDLVLTGHDKSFLGAMIWPNLAACRELLGPLAEGLGDEAVAGSAEVAAALAERIKDYNSRNRGSSTRIARFVVLTEPPSVDANEITDKGYVNQRSTLTRRARIVEALHAPTPAPHIINLEPTEPVSA